MPFGVWDHHVNAPVVDVIIGWMVVVVVLGLVDAVSIVVDGLKSVLRPRQGACTCVKHP